MERTFSQTMSELRKARGYSQRKVAEDLNISQALLSHYENGAREPGLSFVCRACKYYGVSADYLLGISEHSGATRAQEEISCLIAELEAMRVKLKKTMEAMDQ